VAVVQPLPAFRRNQRCWKLHQKLARTRPSPLRALVRTGIEGHLPSETLRSSLESNWTLHAFDKQRSCWTNDELYVQRKRHGQPQRAPIALLRRWAYVSFVVTVSQSLILARPEAAPLRSTCETGPRFSLSLGDLAGATNGGSLQPNSPSLRFAFPSPQLS
jgi:hypothetical protein